MQPLPEVEQAAERLAALGEEVDLLRGLAVLSEAARSLIPSLVGVSLTVVVDGEPFTLTATSQEIATLDAAQYVGGGPCLEAAGVGSPRSVEDVLDEDRWQLYGQAAAAQGVGSSLSLPLGGAAGSTPGAINLYASDSHAFRDAEGLLSEAFQTPAAAFVSNADLGFSTRDAARGLPRQLEVKDTVDRAAGVLCGMFGWSPGEARDRLRDSAGRADVPLERVAELMLALASGR